MKTILEELRGNNSSNYKLEVLEKHKDNELLKKVLYYTYNTEYQYFIKQLPEISTTETGINYDVLFQVLDDLRLRKYTGNAAKEYIEQTFIEYSNDLYELFKLIISRDLKCKVDTKSINKVFKNLIPTTPYMRCSKLDEKTIDNISFSNGAILQKKADGLFCYAIKNNGVVKFKTRNGSTFSIPKLEQELLDLPEQNFVLSGELLIKYTDRELDRKTGNGLINSYIKRNATLDSLQEKYEKAKTQKQMDTLLEDMNKKNMEFGITENTILLETWDYITYEEYCNEVSYTPYLERLQKLNRLLVGTSSFVVIETHKVDSIEEVHKITNKYYEDGYEGTILKDINAIWENKTSKYQLKVKKVLDADLKCIGYNPGTKQNEGGIGSLQLVSKCGNLEVSVGSGLSMEQRGIESYREGDKLLQRPISGFDLNQYNGKIIEIQYNEVIQSKGKDKASLFLPIFVTVRDDKDDYNTLEDLF